MHRRVLIGVTGPDRGGLVAWSMTALALRRCGARGVRITPSRPCDPSRLHGLVIGGGTDVHPLQYGSQDAPPDDEAGDEQARDAAVDWLVGLLRHAWFVARKDVASMLRMKETILWTFVMPPLFFWFIGAGAPPAFLAHFTVFVLACFVGYMVVWNVKPALHTPLMSVTNAISSIIAIGALVQIAPPMDGSLDRPDGWIRVLAIFAIVLATINMFGGFAVTQRMLAMFRK